VSNEVVFEQEGLSALVAGKRSLLVAADVLGTIDRASGAARVAVLGGLVHRVLPAAVGAEEVVAALGVAAALVARGGREQEGLVDERPVQTAQTHRTHGLFCLLVLNFALLSLECAHKLIDE